MSVMDATSAAATPAESETPGGAGRWWAWFDSRVERWGDRLNPIVVKEARQALKSRQFLVTFSLLLFCGVAWSFVAVSFTRDVSRLAQAGGIAFSGYYVVLAIPLMVIVPYAAFQSLAAERHEGTFDLLSITTLSSRQIVLGKLASALLQMMVYYSALAPCIAFTYLLPGIDILTIIALLAQVFFLSLLLCSLSLLLAALTRESSLQVVISAALVIGLVIAVWAWLAFAISTFLEHPQAWVSDLRFWVVNLFLLMVGLSFVLLFLEATAAKLRFASANRSTALRWMMLGQQVLIVGWVALAVGERPANFFLMAVYMTAGAYWALMGTMLTSELGELSPRAQRDLPRTALGILMLTWFNPGSGTGYVFALLNMFMIVELGWLFTTIYPHATAAFHESFSLGLMILGYLTLFLGLGRIAILVLRRFVIVNFQAAVLLQGLLTLGAAAAPYMLMTVLDWDDRSYRWYQATNWCWTLYEAQNAAALWNDDLKIAGMLVGLGAVVVLIVNLRLMANEVSRVRSATPRRILEESESHTHPVFDEP